MKKLLLSLCLLLSAASSRAEDLSVVLRGQYRDPVSAYKVGSSYFLAAKDAGALYGSQVYWYPVSGRIQMTLRGRNLQLLANSDKARVGAREVTLPAQVLLRGSHAYVPLSFLLSEEFSAWADADTSFDPAAKILTVDRRSSVGPLRWFSYRDYARIVLELGPRLAYHASARGARGLEVSVPLGAVEASEQGEIEDGAIQAYALKQGPRGVKLSVRLARPGLLWRVQELASPRRLAVNVFRAGIVPTPSEKSEKGAPEPAPQAPAVPAVSTASLPAAAPQTRARRRIVIDAGHGGKDSGATGRGGTLEKNLNLAAALELAKLLKEEGAFDVLLTRTDDTFVPLAERSRLANEFGADLFISLHCNASGSPRDAGFEVYFLSEKATDPAAEQVAQFENSVLELEGKNAQEEEAAMLLQELSKTENINSASELAALMARALSKRIDVANRGVRQAAFYVLRGTHAPAVLFEMGYITNKKDEVKLQSRKMRRRLVDGIYAAILDYGRREGWTGAAE